VTNRYRCATDQAYARDDVLLFDCLAGYDRKMIQRLTAAAAWACLIFVICATLSSSDARPELTGPGFWKGSFTIVERFGAYALLGLLFYLAYPNQVALVCLLVLGSAVILELLQIVIPDRDARVVDALEKIAGGAAGILTARKILALTVIQRQKL
jgi:VanZ family protein